MHRDRKKGKDSATKKIGKKINKKKGRWEHGTLVRAYRPSDKPQDRPDGRAEGGNQDLKLFRLRSLVGRGGSLSGASLTTPVVSFPFDYVNEVGEAFFGGGEEYVIKLLEYSN